MPGHMSSIGFRAPTADVFGELAQKAARQGIAIIGGDGQYRLWRTEPGIELWAQVRGNELVGLNPHFNGDGRMRVALVARIPGDAETLDGAFYGWANPSDESDPESGEYPFVFEVPDFRSHDDLSLPMLVTVQVCAFAHKLEVFANEAIFDRDQKSMAGAKLGPRAFIPTGLFHQSDVPSRPTALFTGKVLTTQRIFNTAGKQAFQHILVETLGGIVDVVVEPELLQTAVPIGGIISGSFWLSGRLQVQSV